MRFANPIFLLLLVFIPLLYWFKTRTQKDPAILFPGAGGIPGGNMSVRAKLREAAKYLKYGALTLAIIALARPQAGQKTEEIYNQAIDIMLLMDTSSSMRAIDFKPKNRLDAAKNVAKEFVEGRQYDRIGIVVFGGLAFTQCPLTLDHDAVLDFIDQIDVGMTSVDMTAIGSAIATGAERLKQSTGKSRVMILLTDGRNNYGDIDPLTASQAAAAYDIKIYTIGCGQPGGALYPIDDPSFGRRYVKLSDQELDEDTLAKIAENTGGRYFRATDTESLTRIFKQIDQMEKTEVKALKYTSYTELYAWFLWPAFLLLGLEIFMTRFWLVKIP